MSTAESKRKLLMVITSVLLSFAASIYLVNEIKKSRKASSAAVLELKEIQSTNVIQKRPALQAVTSEEIAKENAQLHAMLKKLESQYAEMDAQLQQLTSLEQSADSQQEQGFEQQLSPEEQQQLARQQRLENLDLMESTLYTEAVDESWSTASEDAVMDALAEVSEQLTVESVECASTLCALHVTGVAGTNGTDVMQGFSRNINWPGEMSLQYDTTTRRGIAYLAREGHALPVAQR